MNLSPSRLAWLDNPLRERITGLHSLLLAYQSVDRVTRDMSWTSKRLHLAQSELTHLQAGNLAEADRVGAIRATHEGLLHNVAQSDSVSSTICKEFIDCGRGYERPSETVTKSDPLAMRWKEHGAIQSALIGEKRRRMEWHGSLKRIIQKDS